MLCEPALNFDQSKIFFENCKPIRVWLWTVYKFTKNNSTHNIKLKVFLWTKLPKNLLYAKYLISVAATLSKQG